MTLTSYNTLTTARATATTLGLTRCLAATDAALTAALTRAALQIDAGRYQGQKYEAAQEHAFPRYADGALVDENATTGAAIVPANVLTAEVLQAEYLLGTPNGQRQQAIADGVASQSVGGQSESYRADARAEAVCVDALQLLRRYELRSGEML